MRAKETHHTSSIAVSCFYWEDIRHPISNVVGNRTRVSFDRRHDGSEMREYALLIEDISQLGCASSIPLSLSNFHTCIIKRRKEKRERGSNRFPLVFMMT